MSYDPSCKISTSQVRPDRQLQPSLVAPAGKAKIVLAPFYNRTLANSIPHSAQKQSQASSLLANRFVVQNMLCRRAAISCCCWAITASDSFTGNVQLFSVKQLYIRQKLVSLRASLYQFP